MNRDELVSYLDEYLDAGAGEDYCPNGLQVEGRAEVHKIITAVSSCEELFVQAKEQGADAVLVHHGLFWNGMSYRLTGMQYRRLRHLFEAGINLIAYHLPLDRHGEVGNNVLAAQAFGLQDISPFAVHKGLPIGFKGRFPEPISAQDLVHRTAELYGREPLHLDGGEKPVESLGIVSGGAQRDFYSAISEGLDAFITGEVSEWVMNVAKESQTHYLAAGHYATERLGVRKLGEDLAERFGLDVTFVDLPNPV